MLTEIQKQHIDVLYENGMDPVEICELVDGANEHDVFLYCNEKQ